MRKPIVMLGVVAGLLGARDAAAQAAPEVAAGEPPALAEEAPRVNSLERGARALSFSIRGTGSGSFGYTRMRSDERSITWEVDVRAAYQKREIGHADESRTDLGFRVGPTFRRYWEPERRVVPFFAHRYFVGYDYHHASAEVDDRPDNARANQHFVSLGAGAAVGLEWFPVLQMSVRGETGLSGFLGSDFGQATFGPSKHSNRAWRASLGTYTAGLTASLYLPRRER